MAFSTNGTGGNGLSGVINVTPLIDVLLVLLIIFMVIVPAMPHGLETALPSPKAGSAAVAMQPVLVRVELGAEGVSYWVDDQSIARTDLRPRLAELLSHQSGRLVLLEGDGALGFEAIAGVIDAAYADGAGNVELMTPGLRARP